VTHEGKAKAIEVFKAYHHIAKKVAMKETFIPVPFRKSDKGGFPMVLKPLRTFLESDDKREVRLGMTAVRVVELLRLSPEANLQPIITPGPALDHALMDSLSTYIKAWIKRVFGTIRINRLERPYGRLVRGPNGPAILTSHYDALAIKGDPDLHKAISSLGAITAP